MLKKAGLVTLGVGAGLMAVAPMASAGEAATDSGHSHSKGDNDWGHGKGHHKGHGSGNTSCASQSGDVAGNHSKGALALGPILNGNSGQLLSCNSFLNNNLNHNKVEILNDVL